MQKVSTEMNQERKGCILAAMFFLSDSDLYAVLQDTSV